jgi:hypothetical protein
VARSFDVSMNNQTRDGQLPIRFLTSEVIGPKGIGGALSTDDISIISAIQRGEAILLTGAGFSHEMLDQYGDQLPVGKQLAQSIWPIAFGEEDYDDTALSDVYQSALGKSPKLLREQLERLFTVDRDQLPARYTSWLSLPWHRVYTLNIDDGDEAVAENGIEPRLQILSALNSRPGDVRSDSLPVIHVNGRLQDFPNLTFSPWDFADRTAGLDPWYQEFATDIATRPVVVIGSIVDEPPLWHFMRLRELRGGVKEQRPRSWLITPRIDLGRKNMLHELNFKHLAQTEAEFYETTIAPHASRLAALGRISSAAGGGDLLDVAECVRSASPGTADYLLGLAPTWGDVTNGYAADFAFDKNLDDSIEGLSAGTISVIGSAGSGKTTSLMKAAAKLAAQNNKVLWLGRETELRVADIRKQVHELEPDFVFIDDVDRFGNDASVLLSGLQRAEEALVVVVAARSARFFGLRYDSILQSDAQLTQDRLTDSDADALLVKLEQGKRLGEMRRLSPEQRVKQLTRHNDRQLLVTLIEATSGEKFHDRIAGECRDLQPSEQALYGIACTAAWADNKPLSIQDLLFAANQQNRNEALLAVRRLVSAQLLVRTDDGYLVRHRVVAESAVDFFRDEGLLHKWITDLIFLAASHYEPGKASGTRLGRMLIRLISHKNLHDLVGDGDDVARIYGAAEEWLDGDFHFWLQRGSYEIDFGELPLADNFLRQARGLVSDDALVETAWAHLQLKRALLDVTAPKSAVRAQEGLGILSSIMQNPSSRSPHTFATFLIFGLQWLKKGPLRTEEKRKLREDILRFGEKGRLLHPRVDDVQESWGTARRWIETNPLPLS